ncbi:MAG: hypothetical protein WC492_01450 [Candidatus Micrarchaeia archaeon]
MGDDINYVDLLILKKMDSDSSVEKFGMQINTSFFDTANILGSMKLKGLIDIQSSLGGQSPITITGEGKDIISGAIQKAGEPIDSLDQEILNALVTGVRNLSALQKVINIRSRDLAFHLYKLKAYDYIDDEIHSAQVTFSLTEKGFLLTRGYRATASASSITQAAASSQQTQSQKSVPANSAQTSANKKSTSIEDEIRDLFNFSSFRKPKQLQSGSSQPSSIQPPPGVQVPASARSGAQLSANTRSSTGVQSPSGSASRAAPPFSVGVKPVYSHHPHPVTSSSAVQKPSFVQSNLSQGSNSQPAVQKKKGLDRTTMLFSKIEFYLQRYAIYGILLLMLFALVIVAVVFAILT